MIEAKRTREEWVNFIGKFAICKEDKAAILREVELHGWITKPEWEQAYNEYLLEYESNPDKEKVILKSFDIVKTMHDRIVELEKIVGEGKVR